MIQRQTYYKSQYKYYRGLSETRGQLKNWNTAASRTDTAAAWSGIRNAIAIRTEILLCFSACCFLICNSYIRHYSSILPVAVRQFWHLPLPTTKVTSHDPRKWMGDINKRFLPGKFEFDPKNSVAQSFI